MISISLCLIVKNEEDTIVRCLNSVKDIVDEINIVDTGSTDKTKELVANFTDRIYDFVWVDDFAKARNYAFEQATKDYIMWLDADDVLLEKDRNMLLELKESLKPNVDSVMMYYNLTTDEFGNVTSRLKRNRLVKRSGNFKWIGAVHEYLEVRGDILQSDIAITHKSIHHDSDRNLQIYEKKLSRNENFSPRDLYYYANELFDHRKLEQAITYYQKFLNTGKGWIEDRIAALGKIADCYFEIGNKESAFESILQSFRYDQPRPENCCRLGYYFLTENAYHQAIYWYKTAIVYENMEDSIGIVNLNCSTWLPNLQLCICYYQLGNNKLAYHYNEVARRYRPNDERILHNKRFFESILKDEIYEKA